ncbi:MAG: DNA polymerase III subunit delta [Lachnospiraceae bacterium]|nr:DNA polymerase III subunit delta [Lachnospiraceae bacterium]
MAGLNDDIRNRSFRRAYLIYGEDGFLRNHYTRRLADAVCGDDTMNRKDVSGKDTPLEALKDFTDTMPFFAEKRVVVLKDTGLLSQAAEGYAEWVDGLPETACVIFSEESVDKRTKLYKKIQEKGYVQEAAHPDDRAFSDWVLRKIGAAGLSVTKDAFAVIAEMPDHDLYRASGELEKLIGYCLDKGKIEKRDAERILLREPANRIFDMIDALSAGQKKEAMACYYDLLALREPPMRIIFLLGRHFHQLFLVKTMLAEGRKADEIAGALSLRGFVETRMERQARRFSEERLRTLDARAVDLDYAVKSGSMQDTVAAELYMAEILEARKTGSPG